MKTKSTVIHHHGQNKSTREKKPYAPKLTRSVILECKSCDNRYIKTRKDQNLCLKCFVRVGDDSRK